MDFSDNILGVCPPGHTVPRAGWIVFATNTGGENVPGLPLTLENVTRESRIHENEVRMLGFSRWVWVSLSLLGVLQSSLILMHL